MSNFTFTNLELPGLIKITSKQFADHRGYVMEIGRVTEFAQAGITDTFVQETISVSNAGTIRGIHFQLVRPQAKLVSTLKGRVWDVAVDLRPGSATFGHWQAVELNASKGDMLYIPKGFGHGFLALEDNTVFYYKTGDYYGSDDQYGVVWNDPTLNINWPLMPGKSPLLSAKDADLPEYGVVVRQIETFTKQ